MKILTEVLDFENKKVLVRVDWNVPVNEKGEVADSSRIEVSVPTIEYIKNHGGKPVVTSHFGREGESLTKVIEYAKTNFPILSADVGFLENLRIHKGEEENSEEFAEELASNGEIYVNDAFSVSHREHASIVGVPRFLPSFAGFRFLEEYNNISKVFDPKRPFLAILGGAKPEKVALIEKMLTMADNVFVGGILASHLNKQFIKKNKILIPFGDLTASDINEETLKLLDKKIKESNFVLWNGPLGNYEKGFDFGTKELFKMLNNSDLEAVVGGGDTENVIDQIKLTNSHIFISLSGGAMLEFLEKGTLPGIEALN